MGFLVSYSSLHKAWNKFRDTSFFLLHISFFIYLSGKDVVLQDQPHQFFLSEASVNEIPIMEL